MKGRILRRIAGRCETHDTASPARIRQMEEELGLPASQPPASLADQLANPDLVDCGKPWCRTRSPRP